ncbi:MAG: hypothetical protein LBU06_07245 [Desulfovibrio sp.]|jgi:hypothetical protein|nr:hypothetical protein [Desulfovibrio sp.]
MRTIFEPEVFRNTAEVLFHTSRYFFPLGSSQHSGVAAGTGTSPLHPEVYFWTRFVPYLVK